MTQDATAVDPAGLGAWMRSQGVDVAGDVRLRRIGLGQSNLTYEVTDEAKGRWVARRPPLGELLASAHDVAREHRIMSALHDTDVPTAGVIGLAEDASVSSAPVLVVEFVDGMVIDRMEVAEAMSTAQRQNIGRELARALAALHAVDVDAVGLSELASHAPYAPRQLKRWSRQWEGSRTRELPDLDRLTRWLEQHVPEQRELTIVHGDLHIRNVIADPDTADVRAVVDWELCTLGDPLADLGTTLAYWPEATDTSLGLFEASRLPDFTTRAQIAEEYVARSGRDLADLRFWEVLGMWKIAIIVEGVRRRALDEPANAAEGGPPPASLVDALVAEALDRTTRH